MFGALAFFELTFAGPLSRDCSSTLSLLGVGFEPTGAFYVLANAQHFTHDSVTFAYEILDGAHVAVTPGAAFGSNAEGYLRFSYASSVERIQEGLRRLGAYLARR